MHHCYLVVQIVVHGIIIQIHDKHNDRTKNCELFPTGLNQSRLCPAGCEQANLNLTLISTPSLTTSAPCQNTNAITRRIPLTIFAQLTLGDPAWWTNTKQVGGRKTGPRFAKSKLPVASPGLGGLEYLWLAQPYGCGW